MTTPTPNPEFANATMDVTNSVGDSFGLALPAFGIVVVAVLAVLSSQTLYRWVVHGGSYFAQSVEYALKGVLTVLIVGLLSTPFYLLSRVSAESRQMALYIVVGLAAIYVGLVVVGFIGEKAWHLLNKRHETMTGETLVERFSTDDGETA